VAFRDHWVLTRTPNFLLVVLTNLAIVPIMIVFSAVGGGELRALLGSVSGTAIDPIVLILVAVQGMLASMNQVSSTSISREGGTFWLSKMIPLPARVQVQGKLRYSLIVSALQLATLLVTAAMLFHMDAYHLVVVAALGMLVSWPVSAICLINDMYSPRLAWTEPHQAMKGNFATLGAMLLSGLYLFAGGFAVRMIYKAGMGGLPLYLVVAVIAVVSGFGLQKYMESIAGPRYNAIEA
jgi:ABC-2 type transport system permease protein